MELLREHSFICPTCGTTQNHACDKIGDAQRVEVVYIHQEALGQPHSVEISRNAKGEYSFSVKAYGETIEEAFVKCRDGVRLTKGEIKYE